MNVNDIVNNVRTMSWVDENYYTDELAIAHFNFIYQDLTNEIITELKEDYYYDIAITWLVQNVNRYNIKTVLHNWETRDINKIKNVWIKYNTTDEYFTKVERINTSNLNYWLDYYEKNQTQSNPVFYVNWNDITIFPTPKKDNVWWLKIEVIYQPLDLLITDTEDSIEINKRFHRTIVSWMLPFVYAYKQQPQLEQMKLQEYWLAKQKMLKQLKNRNEEIVDIRPNDNISINLN